MTAAQVTGRIKLYQFCVGGILLLNVPISYITLKMGHASEVVFYVAIGLSIIALTARIFIISALITMKKGRYLIDTLLPVLIVTVLVFGRNSIIYINLTNPLTNFLISALISGGLVVCTVLLAGLNRSEKEVFFNLLLHLKNKIWN